MSLLNRDLPFGSEALKLSRLKLILANPKSQWENNLSTDVQSSSCLRCPWQIAVSMCADVRLVSSDQYPQTVPTAYEAARTRASCLSRTTHTDGSANAVANLSYGAAAPRTKMRLGVTVQLWFGSITARLRVTPAQ